MIFNVNDTLIEEVSDLMKNSVSVLNANSEDRELDRNKDIQELYNEVDNIYSMVSLLLIGAVPSKCPSSFL